MFENDGRPPRRQRASRTGSNSVPGISDELVIFHLDGLGKVLAVLPVVPESAPYTVKEGIARRRLVATTGQCPCGARLDLQAAKQGRVGVADVEHDRLCPATTRRLGKAIRRWAR